MPYDPFNPEILNNDIVEHIWTISDMQGAVTDYFRYKCDVWKAIVEHIAHAKKCILIDRPAPVAWLRGTGPDIHMHRAYSYRNWGGKPATFIRIELRVGFAEDAEFDPDIEKTSEFRIDVPLELFRNFTKAAFDRWVSQIRTKKESDLLQSDLATLRKLAKRHGLTILFPIQRGPSVEKLSSAPPKKEKKKKSATVRE
jgi:hypothetical protein